MVHLLIMKSQNDSWTDRQKEDGAGGALIIKLAPGQERTQQAASVGEARNNGVGSGIPATMC